MEDFNWIKSILVTDELQFGIFEPQVFGITGESLQCLDSPILAERFAELNAKAEPYNFFVCPAVIDPETPSVLVVQRGAESSEEVRYLLDEFLEAISDRLPDFGLSHLQDVSVKD